MNDSLASETLNLSTEVRCRAVGEDGVLVHLQSGKVIVVNEVGLHIVQQLGKPITRDQLTASIVEEFSTTEDQARTDLALFLAELDRESILSRH